MTSTTLNGVKSAGANLPLRIRASTPVDLVAVLPYLFGFVPSKSVIVLALEGRQVLAAGRFDTAAALDLESGQLAASLAPLASAGSDHVVVGWHDAVLEAEQAAARTVAALRLECQTIIVSNGRCRADGGAWANCAASLPAADTAGLAVLGDRQAVADKVAGPRPGDALAERRWASARVALTHRSSRWCHDRLKTLLRRGLADPEALSDADRVELAALVKGGLVRDGVWATMTLQRAGSQVVLWSSVVALVPDDGAVAPLGLLGVAAWLAGQGALATCCLERGLAIDGAHSLLRLFESIHVACVPPGAWPNMRQQLMAQIVRNQNGEV